MLRNKHLKSQAQLLVMNVMDYFQRERDNQGVLVPFESIMQRTAEACGISINTVSSIKRRVMEAQKENKPPQSPAKKRKRTKSKSCDVDDHIKNAVKRKIYDMHSNRVHVTISTLQEELTKSEIFNFSRSSLRRLLHSIGFSFKLDDGRRGLLEQPHIATSRVRFLREYFSNKDGKLFNPVFLDETWIFSRGSPKKNWHDDSKQSIKKKPIGEGKRFIVLHAGNEEGFIPNASLLFSTKSQSADYHGDMCAELFTKWFETDLIPNLNQPSLIILDNASYHSKLVEKIPNTSSRKEEVCSYLVKHNIAHEQHMFKRELLQLVNDNAKPKVYEIDEIAFKHGHKVLRLPPYHCQFNPIELIWANCKEFYNKNVGKFNAGFNDEHVRATWLEALQRVDANYWHKCIAHAEKCMFEWWETEKRFEIVQPLIISVGDSTSESDSDTDNE